MKKLRTLFYLLLATNLVLAVFLLAPAFGLQDLGGPTGEPERLTNQLHTENIRVFPAGFEPVAKIAPSATPQMVAVVPAVPAQPAAQICVAYQNLNADQAQTLTTRARGLGDTIGVNEEGPSSYRVSIPPQGGKQGAERRANDLRQMGIADFFIVQEAGATQYSVSLGLYHSEAAARRQLDNLQKKGLNTARISTVENARSAKRVELTGPSDVLQRLGQDLADTLKGAEQAACQAG